MVIICNGNNKVKGRGIKDWGERLVKINTFDLGTLVGTMVGSILAGVFHESLDFGVQDRTEDVSVA